jgi:uncharacterized surface protein with fasciclin (FAS1) repeats
MPQMRLVEIHAVRPRVLLVAALVAMAALPARAVAQDSASAAPPKPLLAAIAALGDYDNFLDALKATGLDAKLSSGVHTVYAPNNAAFARLNPDTLAALKADKARLTRVLSHHIIEKKFEGIDMMHAPIYTKIPTMAGDSMIIYHDKGGIKVDYKLVKIVDLPATDGVIHTVREIMLVP